MPLSKYELRDAFVEDVQKIYNLYNSLSSHATDTEKSLLAEQTIVSLTVALESFISELLVTLISENPDLYLTNQTQEMKLALLKAGYSHAKIQLLANDGRRRITAEDLREIILNDGDNITFPETRMLRDFIIKNLPGNLRFEISIDEEVFIDLLKSTRNLCAHHSQKSARALSGNHKNHFHNVKVNTLTVCLALVQEQDITVASIGAYLRFQVLSNRDRVEYVAHYLREMVFRWIK